jgi:hypothetical protein
VLGPPPTCISSRQLTAFASGSSCEPFAIRWGIRRSAGAGGGSSDPRSRATPGTPHLH